MLLSKHHYAKELAKLGNIVYFLNPPNQERISITSPSISIREVQANLYIIDHILFFPYSLKFHAMSLFHGLMRLQIERILRKLKAPIDIVWSFDLGFTYPLSFFNRETYRIFHPVDEPLDSAAAIAAARGANVIFSVTREILNKYGDYNCPRHFINHGVAEDFLKPDEGRSNSTGLVRVGFSGNLLRADIDRQTLLQIVKDNKDCQFEFWGSYQPDESNIGGADDEYSREFVRTLRDSDNVILHGVVSTEVLASSLHGMDVLLICYDVLRDQSRGTNYHKVMEYLATGSVIISNNITTYKEDQDLIMMIPDRDNNRGLPRLFASVLSNLAKYNSKELRRQRITFASGNTYKKQIERIEILINE